jgi:hypothetical protein
MIKIVIKKLKYMQSKHYIEISNIQSATDGEGI